MSSYGQTYGARRIALTEQFLTEKAVGSKAAIISAILSIVPCRQKSPGAQATIF